MTWPIAWRATSSSRATRRGTPHGRPGTWPSISGRSPSSTRSGGRCRDGRPLRRGTPPSASPSTPVATTPAPSTGARTRFAAAGGADAPTSRSTSQDGAHGSAQGSWLSRSRSQPVSTGSPTSPAPHPTSRAGYALGGGISWMVRKHGLACNSILAADVVTADGRQLRVDAETQPRAVLGAPRWRRQRRRGDRARARACSRSPRSSPGCCSGRSSARRRS